MAYQDIITRILNVLRDNYGSYFKSYYDGDPGLIPQSNLPAICVTQDTTDWTLGPTGFDEKVPVVTIKLVLNKKDDFGASDTVDLTDKKIRILMEGQDDAGLLLLESVVGTLRTNYTLGQAILNQEIHVQYGVLKRGGPEDLITSEGHSIVTAKELVQIPNRS